MIFLLIVLMTIIIIAAYKPRRKSADYYMQHPELNRTVNYHCRQISSFSSFLNFGADKSNGLEVFSYNNRQVYLRTRKGKTVSGMLENLKTTFVKYPMSYGGYFACEVKCGGQKIEFYNFDGLFSDEEYLDIWEILSHSGKVGGQSDYNSFKKSRKIVGSIKNSIKRTWN